MRPIETEYRSVTFRSRTEARWAVFFDAMEWKWMYEKFEIPFRKSVYIPDFIINAGLKDFFAEVKPISFWELTALEIDKAWEAADYIGACLMLVGEISNGPFWMLSFDEKGGRKEEQVYIGNYRAIEAAKRARFDGCDNDRTTIQRRYE